MLGVKPLILCGRSDADLITLLHVEGEVIDEKSDPVGKKNKNNPEDFLYNR